MEVFEKMISIAFQIEKEINMEYFEVYDVISIIGSLSGGLGLTLSNHARDNRGRFTMTGQNLTQVSPVEISANEEVLGEDKK